MNLANPTGQFWAGLAVPIVIFYILKIRLRRVPVSTLLFWRQIFEEKKPRSWWQRLRHLLSLLVQLAFLFLLVGALAQPFFAWENHAARRIVLVIDNSASMNATDVQPTRLARAKELGQRVIDGLRARDQMAIIAAGTQPQVICGRTEHQRTLHEHLDAVPVGEGPTRVVEAIALARRLLDDDNGQQQHVHMIVLTDGCEKNLDKIVDSDTVRLVGVGQRSGNVALTAFQVRRSLTDPIGYEILVEVVNHSDEPVECRLEIHLNDALLDVEPLKLAANGKWSKVMEKTSAEGGRLTAHLDREDALAADNRAVALLPPRALQPVVLVSSLGDLFLEKVLEANPLVRLSVSRKPLANPPPNAVVVYHRQTPNPLPSGPALVIAPEGDGDLWRVGNKLQNPIVTKQDRESPLMAHVRLDNVLMPEARALTFTPSAGKPRILAAALNGEPLLVALDRPQGKVVVLTVNLDKGDLPLRTAFPILVTNALNWFAGEHSELREALATGSTTEVTLPDPIGNTYLLQSPDGQTRKLPPGVQKTTVGPLDRCGVWSIVADKPDAEPIQEIACNLANRDESDLRPPESLPSWGEEPTRALGFTDRPIWFYLLAAAWLLIALEWYLYQRRWIS
jgi:hypothetical protein